MVWWCVQRGRSEGSSSSSSWNQIKVVWLVCAWGGCQRPDADMWGSPLSRRSHAGDRVRCTIHNVTRKEGLCNIIHTAIDSLKFIRYQYQICTLPSKCSRATILLPLESLHSWLHKNLHFELALVVWGEKTSRVSIKHSIKRELTKLWAKRLFSQPIHMNCYRSARFKQTRNRSKRTNKLGVLHPHI